MKSASLAVFIVAALALPGWAQPQQSTSEKNARDFGLLGGFRPVCGGSDFGLGQWSTLVQNGQFVLRLTAATENPIGRETVEYEIISAQPVGSNSFELQLRPLGAGLDPATLTIPHRAGGVLSTLRISKAGEVYSVASHLDQNGQVVEPLGGDALYGPHLKCQEEYLPSRGASPFRVEGLPSGQSDFELFSYPIRLHANQQEVRRGGQTYVKVFWGSVPERLVPESFTTVKTTKDLIVLEGVVCRDGHPIRRIALVVMVRNGQKNAIITEDTANLEIATRVLEAFPMQGVSLGPGARLECPSA